MPIKLIKSRQSIPTSIETNGHSSSLGNTGNTNTTTNEKRLTLLQFIILALAAVLCKFLPLYYQAFVLAILLHLGMSIKAAQRWRGYLEI